MVDIECTRCGAKGTGYATNLQAKFTLVHKEKCGAKIGVPKFTDTIKTTHVETSSISEDKPITVTTKSKKKKAKKNSV